MDLGPESVSGDRGGEQGLGPFDELLLSNSIRAAVTRLVRTIAKEFGANGITANNLCLGYTLAEKQAEQRASRTRAFIRTELASPPWACRRSRKKCMGMGPYPALTAAGCS